MSWWSDAYDAGIFLLFSQIHIFCVYLYLLDKFYNVFTNYMYKKSKRQTICLWHHECFLPRLQCRSQPITMAVPGLPVWTGNGRGQEVMHVNLDTISCDIICNSQSKPAEAESSLVYFEETTVFQRRKNVKRKTLDFFCNIIIIILMKIIMINILFIIIIEYYHLSIKMPSSLLFICFVYFSH